MRQLFKRLGDGVSVALFTALFLVFIVQIVARFVFQRPLPWTDELAVMLYVWVILWSAALVVPEREHVMFDLVWNAVGPAVRRVLRIVGHGMLGGLCAWALPATWDYVHFMAREGTPVLGVPFMLVFAPFVLLMVALIVRSAVAIVRAWRGLDLGDAAIPSA
ncbi:TRAP transporter small permease [Leptothrix discophora]|uniref:TRAP transporter small permease protein n=1 Tax=Leptothrix discophora TaxID=89 RepID=A0ABT9G4T2_LEPDI|nr:TRAP transporter small permease [Leptothrix discophora]MDP4301277.1 TRAP transporter small permease [Leptothrix discophora]